MKRKVVIFQTHLPSGKGGGIKVYCDAVKDLFSSDPDMEVVICPILPHATRFFGNKFEISKIVKYLDKEKPDIIHINGYASLLVSQLVPLSIKRKIKIVYTPHWHPFSTMQFSMLKKIHFDIFVKPYIKNVDVIVNINREEFGFFRKFSSKTVLIPHWNLGKVKYDPTIKKDSNMILFVGNLFYKNKGVDYLFKLPKDKYKIHCVGRGNIDLRSDMIQHQNISNKELEELYNKSSLVVVPSHYEAFSYTALEALTCGTPIVVSNNVRFADFIETCPQCKIFEYGNYEDFVQKVESTIGVDFNPDHIVSKFSLANAKELYKNLYFSLL